MPSSYRESLWDQTLHAGQSKRLGQSGMRAVGYWLESELSQSRTQHLEVQQYWIQRVLDSVSRTKMVAPREAVESLSMG